MGLFTPTELQGVPKQSEQQSVSTGFQPYVSNMLDKAQTLTSAPTPQYTGEMAAGPSALQNQAFQGLSNLTLPTSLMTAGTNLQDIGAKQQALNYTPTGVTTNTFNAGAAEQYMNPYIQQALDPQLAALTRQHKINQQGDMAKLAQAGAYGGSRQAILQGQGEHNLLGQQAGLIGSGYNQAYNNAATQFNADQARNLQGQQLNQAGNQFAATYGLQGLQAATQANTAAANAGAQQAQYGLQNLTALGTAGGTQQQLAQAKDNAAYNEYLRQLKYPQDMLTLQKNMLSGMPMQTTNTFAPKDSIATGISGAISGASTMYNKLKEMGMAPDAITNYLKSIGKTPEQIATSEQYARMTQKSDIESLVNAGAVKNPDGTYSYTTSGVTYNYKPDGTFINQTGITDRAILDQGVAPVNDINSGFGPTPDQNYNGYNPYEGAPITNPVYDTATPDAGVSPDGNTYTGED